MNVNKELNYPIKCLLWGSGKCFNLNFNLIANYIDLNRIQIEAIVTKDEYYSSLCGYKVIQKNEICKYDFELIIIMADSKSVIQEIREEARKCEGVKEYSVIPYAVLKIIGFDFIKYMELKKNTPTIFAPNCFGGIIYHRLGLEFRSPLINMFENHNDFLKFVENPKIYLDSELELLGTSLIESDGTPYPLVGCRDIRLYCNHYKTFEQVEESWNRRKKRVNWNDICVIMFDDDLDRIERFCNLPYKKKLLLAPFEYKDTNVVRINYEKYDGLKDKNLSWILNDIGNGIITYFDIFELLVNAQLVKLAELR